MQQYRRVEFRNFKAFKSFTLHLKHTNILVGPNNAGKSTILAAFRILAAALRRAASRRPSIVHGPNGDVRGYVVDLSPISVSSENLFFNYDDSEPAQVIFTLSNGYQLTLFCAEQGSCVMIADANGKVLETPSAFKKHFDCAVGFVPILGPVEHDELAYEKEAARLALFNYRAARNFRNIWYHYPEYFDQFRELLQRTWPGMDIEPPERDRIDNKVYLRMFCPEDRIPRELCWSGFGFQVWCQMLTHIVQSQNHAIFLIDEPDIYLHSDLQRQLIHILKNLGPDIVLATHSTEIVTEAEAGDLVLINKKNKSARRINDAEQLSHVFSALGSNVNPILTQLAKTRRAVFVEGKDFQILAKFARKLRNEGIGNRRDFAVIPMEGFNPGKAEILKQGIQTTLGSNVLSGCILDKDYRSDAECSYITDRAKKFSNFVFILSCKEIENLLLNAAAIDRAAIARIKEQEKRSGMTIKYTPTAEAALAEFCASKENYIASQMIEDQQRFEKQVSSGRSVSTISEETLARFNELWSDDDEKLRVIPGKEALSFVNETLQGKFGISVTATAIINAMTEEEIPPDVRALIEILDEFSTSQ